MGGKMDELQSLRDKLADVRQLNENLKQRIAHQQQRVDSAAFRYERTFGRDELFLAVFPEHSPFQSSDDGGE